VGVNCNLAIEFNGLVSKRVNREIGPFYILQKTFEKQFLPVFFLSLFPPFFLRETSQCNQVIVQTFKPIVTGTVQSFNFIA
jgi:hypothetical protein